jgi:hypothetical protein
MRWVLLPHKSTILEVAVVARMMGCRNRECETVEWAAWVCRVDRTMGLGVKRARMGGGGDGGRAGGGTGQIEVQHTYSAHTQHT